MTDPTDLSIVSKHKNIAPSVPNLSNPFPMSKSASKRDALILQVENRDL